MSDVVTAAAEPPKTASPETQTPDAGARWLLQLAVGLALVALADWLFYGHTVGVSAALLLVALAAAAVVANPVVASKRDALIASGVLVASVVPLIVNVGILSALSGALGTAFFTLTMTRAGTGWLDNRTPDSNWWLKGKRDGLAVMHLDGTHGWRAWTWRNRQLTRHLRRTR